jgi:hypothetical protein
VGKSSEDSEVYIEGGPGPWWAIGYKKLSDIERFYHFYGKVKEEIKNLYQKIINLSLEQIEKKISHEKGWRRDYLVQLIRAMRYFNQKILTNRFLGLFNQAFLSALYRWNIINAANGKKGSEVKIVFVPGSPIWSLLLTTFATLFANLSSHTEKNDITARQRDTIEIKGSRKSDLEYLNEL